MKALKRLRCRVSGGHDVVKTGIHYCDSEHGITVHLLACTRCGEHIIGTV
jgi:hypothetical protein